MELLKWRAIYFEEDGNTVSKRYFLEQFNDDGSENRYEDIERGRLARFDLMKPDGKLVHSVYLHEGCRLIFRRRNFIRIAGDERSVVHIAGWVKTVHTANGARDTYSLMYLFEDGTTAHDNHRDNLELLPIEK